MPDLGRVGASIKDVHVSALRGFGFIDTSMGCTVCLMGTIRDRTLNLSRCLMWYPLNILAADGLWFPILIDDERQGIKQWEMARARGKGGGEERGARAAGGRSTQIDGIFLTQGAG